MRILILNTYSVWGGDEKWTINVGKGLSEKGHHVVIAALPGSEVEKKARECGLQTLPFNLKWDIAFWKIPSFQKYLKQHKIDVLLCLQNRDVKIGALAARLIGIPAIFARQGLNNIRQKRFHKIAFTRFVDGIITNTASIKKLYESYGWFKDDFIHVVYDGLTLPETLNKVDLYKEFDLQPGSKIIMATGRLAEQKRFDLLIKVAAMAKAENLNWSIVITGTGRLEADLKKMAVDHEVDDLVKFAGFRSDVLELMYSSDLFVLSSDSEGMSNALREAMAVGLPCVATNVFGVEELFQNGRSGVMVNKGDAKGIFEGIKTVFQNDELRQSISRNGKELIKTVFTMENMIDAIEKIFLEQLAKNKK